MRQITVPDEVAEGLQAVAALEGLDVTEVATPPLLDMLAERYHAVQAAYVALSELDPDNGRPDGKAPVSSNGATKPRKKPAKNNRSGSDDGGAKKGPSGARCKAGDGTCKAKYAARGMCTTHWSRWRDGKIERAPDGTLSPALETADTPSDPVEKPEVEAPPAVEGGCQAARCGDDALGGGAKFCQHHAAQVPRIAEKLRRSSSPPDNASAEAVRRLIEGVR